MIVKVSFSSLRNSHWHEYIIRFVLGGAATVTTGLISSRYGPAVGGLFLALPAVFCASATLIETHEERRKREAGFSGQRRGQEAAALDAAGTALGSFGMIGFALVFSLLAERLASLAFTVATISWCVICVAAWWAWRHVRLNAPARSAKAVRFFCSWWW
jgi:hypothetical protein